MAVSAGRAGAVYAASTALPRAVSFGLMPLLTRALEPAEFGRLAVALVISFVAGLVFTLGMDLGALKAVVSFKGGADKLRNYVASLFAFTTVVPLTIAAPAAAASWLLIGDWQLVTGQELALALLVAATYSAGMTLPLAVLRAHQRLAAFSALNVMSALVGGTAGAILTLVLDLGPSGWLLGALFANLATLVLALVIVPFEFPRPFDRKGVADTLKYSLPIVPHYVVLWTIQSLDRLVVAIMLTVAAAGTYSLASNMALPMLLVASAFGQAFMPSYAGLRDDGFDHARLREVMKRQVAIGLAACTLLALISPFGVTLLADPSYAPAAPLVSWIVVGYGIFSLNSLASSVLLIGIGESRTMVFASAAGAVVNSVVVVLACGQSDLTLVAVASPLGYLTLLVVNIGLVLRHRVAVPVPWRFIGCSVGCCAAVILVGTNAVGEATAVDLLVRTALGLAGAGALVALVARPALLKPWVANR